MGSGVSSTVSVSAVGAPVSVSVSVASRLEVGKACEWVVGADNVCLAQMLVRMSAIRNVRRNSVLGMGSRNAILNIYMVPTTLTKVPRNPTFELHMSTLCTARMAYRRHLAFWCKIGESTCWGTSA